MGISRDGTERGGFALLFLLLALVPLALLGLGPDAGVAQGQEGGIRVTGEGRAAFPSPADEAGEPGCRFSVGATRDETGSSGSFLCELDPSTSFGLPITSTLVGVTALEAPSPDEAMLEGPALVELPGGGSLEDVPATVHLHAGGPGTGTIQIVLRGVFDGQPGDEFPGDGDYSLVTQEVTEGSIDIQTEAPGPSPSPSVSPTGSPGPSPSPTGSPSPSPSPTQTPSPHPSPTSSLPGPPVPPNPGSGGPQPNPPDGGVPFTLGGTHSTARLMAILAGLSSDGNPRLADILSVAGPFPVAGLAWWQNDWHAYRCCPYTHLHQGLDMFAPRGTPVVAAADGIVSQRVDGPVSGMAVEITDAGRTEYFYAHLSAFAPGIGRGARVHVGQVLGYVGTTGNAVGTAPHLHFEVQPNGVPVPPMPFVDAWLSQSEQRALTLLQQRTGRTGLDEATIRLWIRKALALAGRGTNEAGDEAAIAGPGSRPTSTLLDLHESGPLIAFAAGALFLLIVMPAVMGGLRESRKGRDRARGRGRSIRQREPHAPPLDGERAAAKEQPDPAGLGRHRPAAR